jgi:DNA-binding transcriptional regulator GbsR (MarR family)
LPINYDVETIKALYESLKEIVDFLDIKYLPEVHVNNRKFIDAICLKFSLIEDKKEAFFRLLDDFYKISKKDFEKKLEELSPENFEEILKILNTQLEDLEINDENVVSSLEELKKVYTLLKNS